MDKSKPNDILVATINNPLINAYDLMSNNILGENTSLFSKEDYKTSKFVKNAFTINGKFDEDAFNKMYELAASKYYDLTNEQYINGLDEVQYNPFDITRPKDAKTYSVSSFYKKEVNPFQTKRGWSGIGSVNESPFSLREIAQQSKVYDPTTKTWSKESLNDLSIKDKLFGETLVYAQYDEDGEHIDLETGYTVKHKKGDWKINEEGKIYTEKLAGREIYGKQVVNPFDIMTTDGSLFDRFNFFDSDDREKSVAGTSFKLAAQIAPYLVPGFNAVYGGVTAAINLAAVLPTFYKSFEGMLSGDTTTSGTKLATAAEGYMSKFVQTSISDTSQDTLFNYEQLGQLVTSVFAQIYQQRAAASLAKVVKSPKSKVLDKKIQELLDEPTKSFISSTLKSNKKFGDGEIKNIYAAMAQKVPGMKELREQQSHMAKAFNLGYMALVTSADIYGEAIEGGYDRRTAGFATLAATAGQYTLMMNNRMGDWFLDKTTGYDLNTNKALVAKSVKEFLEPVKTAFAVKSKDGQKKALATVLKGMKAKMEDIFLNPSELGENLFKHAVVEGVEEFSEEAVMDMTKGFVDVLSYLGLTKNRGTFGGFENVFSKDGLERYVASFVGGAIGGPLFEYNATRIEPKIKSLFKINIVTPEVKTSIYQLIGNGQSDLVVEQINKQKRFLGNNFIKPAYVEGDAPVEPALGKSEADIIAENAIGIIRVIEGIMNSNAVVHTNEDIVRKAFVDHEVIKALEAAKGDFSVGIEGLVLTDYTKNLNLLVEKNLEILELSKSKTEEKDNSEAINRLKKEASIYKDNINDILEGKKAQHYFDRAVTYLNKDLLNSFVAVDRDSYAKIKYKESYYDMPDTGIGITKEKVNKEWKSYVDSGNIVNDLEVAVEAILNLEKLSNEAIAKFSESGYNIERMKTVKDFLNTLATINLFSTDPDKKEDSFKQFTEMSKALQSKTGKKVIPWDVVKINIFEKLLNDGFIVDSETGTTITQEYLEQMGNVGDGETVKKDLLIETINNALALLPPDNVNIEIFSEVFNSIISNNNELNNRKIEQLLVDKNILTEQLSSKSGSELENVKNKISDIETQIETIKGLNLNVQILPKFSFTQTQKNKIDILEDTLNAKVDARSLNKEREFLETLKDKEYDASKVLSDVEAILSEKVDGKKKKIATVIEELNAYLENNDVFNKESLHSNLNSPVGKNTDKVKNFVTALKNDKGAFQTYQSITREHENFLKSVEEEKSSLENTNFLFHALLKEFKDGNRDGELLEMLKKIHNDSFEILSSKDTSKVFKDSELLEILTEGSEDLQNLEEVRRLAIDYVITRDDEYSWENPEEIWKSVQSSINSIKNESLKNKLLETIKEDLEKDALKISLDNIVKTVNNIVNFKNTNKSDFEILTKSNEMFSKAPEFISNSIYDFIKEFSVSLDDDSKMQTIKLMDIFKREEFSLKKASDVSNYLSDGVDISIIQKGLNVLAMFKSIVNTASTTNIDENNPYGFIALRQQFAKKNNTKSDVLSLKTVSSDVSTLINNDISRLENKLGFLKVLLLGNSGRLFEEQEEIREKTNGLILEAWKDLTKLDIKLSGNSIIDDLDEVINNKSISHEEKLLKIGESFYEKHKNSSIADKKLFLKELKKVFPYENDPISIYNEKGTNIINKNIRELSNNDFVLYLASNLVVNSRDFSIRLKQALEGEFDKSPFFTQELAVQIAYASITHSELFEELAISDNENIINTEKLTYILGNSGTGKTNVAFKLLINLLKNNNPNLKMWFAAPYKDQAQKVEKESLSDMNTEAFTTESFAKKELFEALGVTDTYNYINDRKNKVISNSGMYLTINKSAYNDITISDNLPNIIFIDEITHFGAHELYLLNQISKKALEQGKILKIVGAGDTSQDGFEFEKISFNVDYSSGIFPPRLSLTARALNSLQRKNFDFLASLASQTRQLWKESKDDYKVLELIGEGIPLSFNLSKNTLNGVYSVTGDSIPENAIQTLSNIVKDKPTTKIGILSDSLVLSDKLLEVFKKYGIEESNYKIYTPDNIQGSESDYFILHTSLIHSGKSLASKIRTLNTYITRGKHGTILINDAPGNLPFNLVFKEEDYSRPVNPLTEEVIKENKQTRIKALVALLGDDLKIKYDYFKFEPEKVEDTVSTKEEEGIEMLSLKSDDKLLDIETGDVPISSMKQTKDSYMVHTFYTDLNATKVFHAGENKYSLEKREGSFYGLRTGKVTEQELDKIISDYVKLKNSILLNKGHDEDFEINGKTVRKTAKGEFVIRKSSYDKDYNTPHGKLYGTASRMLQDNEIFVNLFYKVANVSGDIEYIHLATFPKLETIKNNVEGGENSQLYRDYKKFMESSSEEVAVDKESFNIHTSTRLVNHEAAKTSRQEFTIKDLVKVPGLRFFSTTTNTFVDKPEIKLFPNRNNKTSFSDFVDLYRKTLFNKDLTDDQLRDMFNRYAGKAYVVVSFMEKGINKGNEKGSHLRIIPLKSKQRPFKEVLKIIHNFKRSEDREKKTKEFAEIKSLFSGSQVLDLLILLAEEKPELYIKLFEPNDDVVDAFNNWTKLEEHPETKEFAKKYQDPKVKEFVDEYYKRVKGHLNKNGDTLIRKIGWANKHLVEVFSTILNAVKDAKKAEKPINKKALKTALVDKIKIQSQTPWFHDFWHMFQLQDMFNNIAESYSLPNTRILQEVGKFAEVMSSTLNEIADFFEKKLDDNSNKFTTGVYYNIPIKGKAGSDGNLQLDTDAEGLNMEYLYTDLAPESPYLLLKTDFMKSIVPSRVSTDLNTQENIESEQNPDLDADETIDTSVKMTEEVPTETPLETPAETAEPQEPSVENTGKKSKKSKKVTVQTDLASLVDKVQKNPMYSNVFKPLQDSLESWTALNENLNMLEKLLNTYILPKVSSEKTISQILTLLKSMATTTDSKNLFGYWLDSIEEQMNSFFVNDGYTEDWALKAFNFNRDNEMYEESIKLHNLYKNIVKAGNMQGNFLQNLKNLLENEINPSDPEILFERIRFLDNTLIKNCD